MQAFRAVLRLFRGSGREPEVLRQSGDAEEYSPVNALPKGRRKAALLIAGGVFSALAFPPFGLLVLLFPSLMLLFWFVSKAETLKQACWSGWFYGLGFYALSLYWVGEAFLVDIARHGWLMPFAVSALAGGMALFFAGTAAMTHGLKRRFKLEGSALLLAFMASWVLVEWLRSWLFTGFPWNLLGQVWVSVPELLQFGSVLGVWGLSLLALLVFLGPYLAIEKLVPLLRASSGTAVPLAVRIRHIVTRQTLRRPVLILVLFWALPGAACFWGAGRLQDAPSGDAAFHETVVRLVQPNIAQKEKWVPELRRGHIFNQIVLSTEAPTAEGRKPDLVIWPETAVPYVLNSNSELQQLVARAAPEAGYLITGAPRYEVSAGTGQVNLEEFYNSLHVLNRRGDIVRTYDKAHLVPFGEYTPLGLGKLTSFGQGGFSAGPGPQTLSGPNLPAFSPLICYEIIFPGAVVDPDNRPDWLLNITNDAWFGSSSGPYQHLSIAQLRAVEEGLPVLRAANTGISAVIDGYGRLLQSYPLGEKGYLDQKLPKELEKRTFFSLIGNMSVFLIVFLLSLSVFLIRKIGTRI
ncbi:apolipoprotein N-acyltransferase [Kiloniella sp. b19]|uniref:apolipoprotein N-acyltransferase n=1 Tax=Kiloniella sp. GXU_MW_B19 TaxID=3141326 RepID=UPI0031E28FC8